MADAPRTMETWATLHRAHAQVMAALGRRLESERGVSVLEHGSLFELNSAPRRRLRMAQLAERLGLTPSATTRLVDRLEERGWVRRESPPENRRTIDVLITTEGRRAYVCNNRPFTAAVDAAMTARMSGEEMTLLIGLLGRLCRARPGAGPRGGA